MNKAKLNALCAKAAGYKRSRRQHSWSRAFGTQDFYERNGVQILCSNYNPIDDANQADDLLEYVAFNLGCSWSCGYNILSSEYWCEIPTTKDVFCENSRTQNVAKILCALRASQNLPADELERAMGEK